MKYIVKIILYAILTYAVILVQTTISGFFAINGIKPNLALVASLLVSYIAGGNDGIVFGWIIGFFQDAVSFTPFGLNTAIYATVGFVSGFFKRRFYRFSPVAPLVMFGGVSLIYSFTGYILFLAGKVDIFFISENVLLPEAFYNTTLTLAIYYLIQLLWFIFKREGKDVR